MQKKWLVVAGFSLLTAASAVAMLTVACWPQPELSPVVAVPSISPDLEISRKEENFTKFVSEDEISPAPVTILTLGDTMLGRSVNTIGARRGDFGWSLREVDAHLNAFDYVITNLETPIIASCPRTDDGMIFCADASSSNALAASSIDLVTLANNHILNYGRDGYRQTQELLTAAGQEYAGSDELYRFTLGGESFGLIAHDDVTFPVDLEEWRQLVASHSAEVDHLLVALHFGEEYRYQPTVRQQALAHASIDAGARLVIGNHSHWLGTVEKYGDGAIIYSHGNFVFDQEWSSETKAGLAAAWTFDGGVLQKVAIYPIYITNYGLAHWAAGTSEGQRILDTFLRESANGEQISDHVEINLQTVAPNYSDQ